MIKMIVYIAKRIIQGLIVILTVSFFCFIVFQYSGDPVLTLAGQYATQAQMEEVRQSLGLDKPFYVQYFRFIQNALNGDFGLSYVSKVPALGMIIERLPATLELASLATIFALTMGLLLGIIVSIKPRAWTSRIIMAGSLAGITIPTFLIGILLIMVFSVWLNVLPPFGRGDTVNLGFWNTGLLTVSGWTHIILPALTLGMFQLAMLLRLTRAGMREVLAEEYIKTAWAKGLTPFGVIVKHALRNVLIPIVTMTGLQFGEQIAFSIVTETIFQWPGMGNLLLQSLYESDHPVIVTYIMIAAVIILTINILVDILYARLDPKIRYA